MNYFRWLLITALTVVAVVCLQLVVCYEMDIYGLFRDPHGREIAVSDVDSDRVMKFLLNQRYVPSNFDGLVIGASNTINYRLTAVQSYRLYNESLEGSNASEERILVEQALHRGHFKIAIVCLY